VKTSQLFAESLFLKGLECRKWLKSTIARFWDLAQFARAFHEKVDRYESLRPLSVGAACRDHSEWRATTGRGKPLLQGRALILPTAHA